MAEKARLGENRIDYSGVHYIDPVPMQRHWMRKALLNLLDNACKYSWTGGKIRVTAKEDSEGIKIEVTNWGVGIPNEHHQRIFEPYFRSNVPDTRGARPGTGVGLTIVKEAIEGIHRGEVLLERSMPWRNVLNEPRTYPGEIIDVEHETTFTILLKRRILNSLAESRS